MLLLKHLPQCILKTINYTALWTCTLINYYRKHNLMTKFPLNYTSSEFEAISLETGHVTTPKASMKHCGSVSQCLNICEVVYLCKTDTRLILWWAETVKNRCCTPHIAVISRNKQVFWCFALLVIFTHLTLLQSIMKAVNCYTRATNIRVAY